MREENYLKVLDTFEVFEVTNLLTRRRIINGQMMRELRDASFCPDSI